MVVTHGSFQFRLLLYVRERGEKLRQLETARYTRGTMMIDFIALKASEVDEVVERLKKRDAVPRPLKTDMQVSPIYDYRQQN